MKKTILLLLLFTSLTAFAHMDTFKVFEKSNVDIIVRFGYESSLEPNIVESYAEIINDFIKEIDSTEKVFIHFIEDYCYFHEELLFLSYSKFLPSAFSWTYNFINKTEYDGFLSLDTLKNQIGLNVIIKEKYFKLKTLLQILEFGLQNKNCIIDKEQIFKLRLEEMIDFVLEEEYIYDSETAIIIDSILQNELSYLTKKYLSKKVSFHDIPEELTQKNIKLFLQNDSILFVNRRSSEILKLSTINSIYYDRMTNCFFILNTNSSFYFINQNLKSNKKQYDLPFKLGCSDEIRIKYEDEKYKLEKYSRFRFAGNEDNWIYFDEIYLDEVNANYITIICIFLFCLAFLCLALYLLLFRVRN